MYAGIYLLGLDLHWPPEDVQHRMLLIVLPMTLAVELLGALLTRGRWLPWLMRLAIAVSAAPILLYGSVYLTQEPGPDSLGWTAAQKWLFLGCQAAALAGVWATLDWFATRNKTRLAPLAVAGASGAAAVAVMLARYATAGPLGVLLAMAVMGTVIGTLASPTPADLRGVLGLGIVGMFSLLVAGRFFGELNTVSGVLLFVAPLLCVLTELPYAARWGSRLRTTAGMLLTGVPLAVAVLLAQPPPAEPTHTNEPTQEAPENEAGLEEAYRNFGK
jgi:hypothetical protein